MLPDNQKVEGKFKLRKVMAGFQGQVEIFLFAGKDRATQQCLTEVHGPHHVIFRKMVDRKCFQRS